MINDRHIVLSVSNTRYGPWQTQQYKISEFYNRLGTPSMGVESREQYLALPKRDQDKLKDVGGFVGGALKDGIRRNGYVQARDLITLDIDNLEPGGARRVLSICASLGCGYAIYSTRKHAPESPRLRVIVPLAQSITSDEYEPCARKLASLMDPSMAMFDRTTFEPARLMYWGSVCADAEWVFYYEDKPLLDGKSLLSMFDWGDVRQWPRCPEEEATVCRTASKQQDPTTKEGIIGAFCRVYDIQSAMDKFIPGVYEAVDNCDDRFTFVGGSTTGGAVLYEDGKFIFSHHATDPACGQLCNAFDMVRIHKFADLDNDAKPGTPVGRLPSYQAMAKLAEADEQVKSQRIEDRTQQIKQDFAGLVAQSGIVSEQTNTSENQSSTAVTEASRSGVETVADEVARKLATLLEDDKVKVTSQLVEAAMAAMGVSVARNEITRNIIVKGIPSLYSDEEALNTLPVLVSDFLKMNEVNAAPDTVSQYIGVLADKNRFNPVKQWLSMGVWDGVDRLEVLHEILGIDKGENCTQYQTYLRKWLIQSIAMAFNGVYGETQSAEGALVLQGPQGCGKTMFFRKLACFKDWFKEGVSLNFDQKDTIINALGGWISELGELDSTLGREQSALKAFITSETDSIRLPYARSSVTRVRRTSFCGTVNPEGFIRDDTGSRRFWVIPISNVDVNRLLHLSVSTIHQIWLQVYSYWVSDANSYRLTNQERERLEKDNLKFSAGVPFQEELEDIMDWSLDSDDRTLVTAAYLSQHVIRQGAKAVAVGRALAAISRSHPEVEQVRSKSSRGWLIPLKKTVSVLA